MQNITYVSHQSYLFRGTVRENLCMGRPEASEEELWQALKKVRLADFLKEQQGLDTLVQEKGSNFSGGQRQRLALARALLFDTPIYIFDDSFSALDFLTEKKLRAALNERIAGKTQIVVTQRVTSAMSADCIFVMDQGRLVDAGTHTELLERCRIYQEIFASQTGGGKK